MRDARTREGDNLIGHRDPGGRLPAKLQSDLPPVVERISATVAAVADLFAEHWPTSAALWLPGGRPPAVRYANPTLADTWERLLAEAESATGREAQIEAARRAWSQGFVAEAVDSFCRKACRDDSGRDHAGVLTGEDMARWSASYEPAVTVELGEWTLAKCGPWSQGPVLAQQLLLLRGFADELCYVEGVPTARTVHLATECAKLAGDHLRLRSNAQAARRCLAVGYRVSAEVITPVITPVDDRNDAGGLAEL